VKRILGLFLVFLFGVTVASAASAARAPVSELKKIEKAIKKEQGLQEEISSKTLKLKEQMVKVRQKQVDVARQIHNHESKINSLEASLEELEVKEKELKNKLSHRDTQMVNVLASLQSLALNPTEVIMAQPTPPIDTLRSAILLKSAVPKLEDAVGTIKKNLSVYQTLRVTIKTKHDQVEKESKKLAEQHKEMEELFAQKAELKDQLDERKKSSAKKLRQLASKAKDLKDLISKLDDGKSYRGMSSYDEPKPKSLLGNSKPKKLSFLGDASSSFADARGKLPYPVQGKVIVKYGDMTRSGTHSKGITLRSRSGAQVISPYDGIVLFAGPFKGYGKILIIKHDDNYHTLLAGLTDIDGQVGQSLLAGEPVGRMSTENNPSLYIELRKSGQPINPLPWLTASTKGFSGG
jgi:septal ring factor EnvC (AmiA/AmiB activator)